jgi:hypothetical protein
MRSGRSLLVLLIIAGALGAYIYFVEMKREPAGTDTKTKVFTVDAGAIEEIEVKVPTGDTTSLKKTGTTWNVAAPVVAAADEATVSSLTTALSTMEIDQVLEENATSFGPFGLDVPAVTVSFKTSGDSTAKTISLGTRAPTGGGIYARIEGQPRLFLIPAFHEDSLKKSTFDLRDKRVLTLAREDIDMMSVAAKGQPAVSVARKGSDWRLSAPIDARADFSPVDGMVGRVAEARMTSVVSEGSAPSASDLKKYGLDTPALVATIGAGSAKALLAIGGKKDDTSLYARDPNRPIVFTVEPSLLSDLTKKADDLRVKTIFEFQPFSARGLDVTHAGVPVSFAKAKPSAATDASAPEVWSQTKPTAKAANETAMTDLLNTLSSLRADRFAVSAPGSGDEMVVAVKSGDASAPTTETVTLRKSGTTVYALRTGEPGAAVVPTADFDKAVTQLQALTGAK